MCCPYTVPLPFAHGMHPVPLCARCMCTQVMLGVDRLDMIKGIPQKLLAFEKFLEEHPEWNDKVCLVQVGALIVCWEC